MFSLYFCAGFRGSHGLEQACICVCIYMFIHERVPAYVCICLCGGVVFSFTYPSLFPALFLTVRKREGRLTGGVGAPLCFFQWWWRWPFLRSPVTKVNICQLQWRNRGPISSIHVELNSKELSRQEPVCERLILYLKAPRFVPSALYLWPVLRPVLHPFGRWDHLREVVHASSLSAWSIFASLTNVLGH